MASSRHSNSAPSTTATRSRSQGFTQGLNGTGQNLLNVTYENNFYGFVKGTIVAEAWNGEVFLGSATAPISINPTRTQTVSLLLPPFSGGIKDAYSVNVLVLVPDGFVVSRSYALFIAQSSSPSDNNVTDTGQDS